VPTYGGEAVEHSSEDTRQLILDALDGGGGAPKHPIHLAVDLGLHVNTVRRHLDILESSGEVERTPEVGGLPGRPRVLFVRRHHRPERGCTGWRFLARAMASYVDGTYTDPWSAGCSAGEAWGGYLVDSEPFSHCDDATALQRAFDLLDELGYAPSRHELDPEAGGPRTVLGRCPFPELAGSFPGLICGFHLGLVRGALEGVGSAFGVVDVDVTASDGPCVLRYAPTADGEHEGQAFAELKVTRAWAARSDGDVPVAARMTRKTIPARTTPARATTSLRSSSSAWRSAGASEPIAPPKRMR
jgi:predicted ArsR family transcriptional regulator